MKGLVVTRQIFYTVLMVLIIFFVILVAYFVKTHSLSIFKFIFEVLS